MTTKTPSPGNDTGLKNAQLEAANSAFWNIIDLCRLARAVMDGCPHAFFDIPEHRAIIGMFKVVEETADAANLKLIEVIE